jgi:hypothetical protein
MIKLEYYLPASHVEQTNQALFEAGAGRIGNYDCCCWVTDGTGQYRPLEGSDPFKGQQGTIEKEPEMKVELVLEEELVDEVRQALFEAHPYETPAYQFIKYQT